MGSHRSHRSHGIALWVGNLTDASVRGWLARIPLGFWAHTDLTDPTVLLCGWEISQMLLRVGWLARIPLCFWAHTDLTDPTVLLCGWKISQMFLRVGWLARIPLCFWAHTDSTDSTVLLCGWEISQMLLRVGWLARIPLCFWAHGSHRSHGIALWVGNLTDASACVDLCGLRWGHIALALTDLFFGPFGQIRPIGPIGQIGHF